jgi:hypothetical protein
MAVRFFCPTHTNKKKKKGGADKSCRSVGREAEASGPRLWDPTVWLQETSRALFPGRGVPFARDGVVFKERKEREESTGLRRPFAPFRTPSGHLQTCTSFDPLQNSRPNQLMAHLCAFACRSSSTVFFSHFLSCFVSLFSTAQRFQRRRFSSTS